MKLYDSPLAPNPRRVTVFMAEKGIEIPTVDINLMKGEHRKPEYREVAPNAKVPALELDDGTVLLETVAICRYLEGLHPEPNLMGRDSHETALIEMWQRRMEFELFLPSAFAFRHLHPVAATLEGQIAEYGEVCKASGQKRYEILDKDLGKSEFIAGDRFTIADITAICSIDFAAAVSDIHIQDGQDNLKRWHAAVSSRPSIKGL